MTVINSGHFFSALFALIIGLWLLTIKKGTRWHKNLGYGYWFAMLALNVSALSLYQRDGQFGPFHIAAVLSLLTLIAGAVPALRRKPKHWLAMHWRFMAWSYVGLVAGALSESIFRLPGMAYWPSIVAVSLLTFAIGGVWIKQQNHKWP
ncbi:DUF2306 domain-containing protein [Paraferrimonas sp. SM1919]|uniref:DUF2306 domain-containing protein n=1 Tax=Paraferrimonas sp. SM1919 TaxID=2662263 RepID=UPI0013D02864|nr:DUF2306 domain-containing protein [Paraferrimonas sp. SM1919]